ncbi:MAG: hypothetical protein M5U09_06505 [Gammaproteobacteria bacterium]|nr:hypothetical protein [Gammaproteobacteria bacterium]
MLGRLAVARGVAQGDEAHGAGARLTDQLHAEIEKAFLFVRGR